MSWKGSYQEGQTHNQLHFSDLTVDEHSGQVKGQGNGPIGKFQIQGQFSRQNHKTMLVVYYPGQAYHLYHGTYQNGVFSGSWGHQQGQGDQHVGQFKIWKQ